jgi:hypothetical protein
MRTGTFALYQQARRLYAMADAAPAGSATRRVLYRQAALAQRQAEAAAELERVTSRRRKAA